jgi:hypothetical protein
MNNTKIKKGGKKAPAKIRRRRNGTNPGIPFTKAMAAEQAAVPTVYDSMSNAQRVAALNRRYGWLGELSPCVRQYAKTLVNPFVIPKEPPCIPDLHSSPSTKFSCWSKGVFNSGTNGFGYIVFDPWLFIVNDLNSLTDGVQNVGLYATNATNDVYSVVTNTLFGDAQTRWNAYVSNSPYQKSDFIGTNAADETVSLAKYRVVAAGIRIRYVGATLTNQGELLAAREATNDDIPDRYTFQQLLGWQNSTTGSLKTFSKKWWSCIYVPATPDDYTYDSLLSNYPEDAPSLSRQSHKCMVIAIDGANTTTPAAISFQAFAHYELIGAPQRTLSHSDIAGLSTVHNTAAQTPMNGDQAQNQAAFHDHMVDSGIQSPLRDPDVMQDLMGLTSLFKD